MPACGPLAKAAIEEACILMPEAREHPPGTCPSRAVVAHHGVGRAHPQRASGHGELLRRAGIGDTTGGPERTVRQEHGPRYVSRGVVLGAPGVDDLHIGVVQVLGKLGSTDQQVTIGVIEFCHRSPAPHVIEFSFLHYRYSHSIMASLTLSSSFIWSLSIAGDQRATTHAAPVGALCHD